MDTIAVLIPCYNEEQTIEKVVTDFKRVLPEAVIYVYDNNSSDRTVEVARKAGAIVRHEYLQGKGNVIRRMFREIDARCYIMTDGDDTYPAEAAREMADIVLKKKADMVVGDRLSSTYYTENKRRFHNFGNFFVKGSLNFIFKSNIKDIMTGYRAFSFQFVKTIPVMSKGFEIETEMTIHAVDKNMYTENVIVDYKDRPAGSESKLNTVQDGMKIIFTIIRLFRTYQPLRFYGLITLLLTIISGALFIPVFADYLTTHMVERFPTLICSGFVMVAALLSLSIGLLLDNNKNRSRQEFEFRLQLMENEFKRLGEKA